MYDSGTKLIYYVIDKSTLGERVWRGNQVDLNRNMGSIK